LSKRLDQVRKSKHHIKNQHNANFEKKNQFAISVSFSDALDTILVPDNLMDDEDILKAHIKINKTTGKRSN